MAQDEEKENHPRTCPGTHTKTGKVCQKLREPQEAGRYLAECFVPWICTERNCSLFGVPFDSAGQKMDWNQVSRLNQIQKGRDA